MVSGNQSRAKEIVATRAQEESFFSRFNPGLIEGSIFESIEHARSEIFNYIEGYFNRIGLHSGLGKSSLDARKTVKLEK